MWETCTLKATKTLPREIKNLNKWREIHRLMDRNIKFSPLNCPSIEWNKRQKQPIISMKSSSLPSQDNALMRLSISSHYMDPKRNSWSSSSHSFLLPCNLIHTMNSLSVFISYSCFYRNLSGVKNLEKSEFVGMLLFVEEKRLSLKHKNHQTLNQEREGGDKPTWWPKPLVSAKSSPLSIEWYGWSLLCPFLQHQCSE